MSNDYKNGFDTGYQTAKEEMTATSSQGKARELFIDNPPLNKIDATKYSDHIDNITSVYPGWVGAAITKNPTLGGLHVVEALALTSANNKLAQAEKMIGVLENSLIFISRCNHRRDCSIYGGEICDCHKGSAAVSLEQLADYRKAMEQKEGNT